MGDTSMFDARWLAECARPIEPAMSLATVSKFRRATNRAWFGMYRKGKLLRWARSLQCTQVIFTYSVPK